MLSLGGASSSSSATASFASSTADTDDPLGGGMSARSTSQSSTLTGSDSGVSCDHGASIPVIIGATASRYNGKSTMTGANSTMIGATASGSNGKSTITSANSTMIGATTSGCNAESTVTSANSTMIGATTSGYNGKSTVTSAQSAESSIDGACLAGPSCSKYAFSPPYRADDDDDDDKGDDKAGDVMRVRMMNEANDDDDDTAAAASIIWECWSPCRQPPQTSAGKTSSTATGAGAKRKKTTNIAKMNETRAADAGDVDDDDDDNDVRGGKRRTKRRCYTATADTSRADTLGSSANDVSGIAEWNGELVLSYFRCAPLLLTRSTQPSLPSRVGKLSTARSGLRRGVFTCVGWQVTIEES